MKSRLLTLMLPIVLYTLLNSPSRAMEVCALKFPQVGVGVLVDNQPTYSLVATSGHIAVAVKPPLRGYLPSGKSFDFYPVVHNRGKDVAIYIGPPLRGIRPVRIRVSPRIGRWVICGGYGRSGRWHTSTGLLVKVGTGILYCGNLVTGHSVAVQAQMGPGDSGGPICNGQGELIGLIASGDPPERRATNGSYVIGPSGREVQKGLDIATEHIRNNGVRYQWSCGPGGCTSVGSGYQQGYAPTTPGGYGGGFQGYNTQNYGASNQGYANPPSNTSGQYATAPGGSSNYIEPPRPSTGAGGFGIDRPYPPSTRSIVSQLANDMGVSSPCSTSCEGLTTLRDQLNEVQKRLDEMGASYGTVPGTPGVDGVDGKDGAPGRDGKDGRDADPDEVAKRLAGDEQFLSAVTKLVPLSPPEIDYKELSLEINYSRLAALLEQGDEEPLISHIVIVRDTSARYWPEMEKQVQEARGHFSRIEEEDPPNFSTPLPALVVWSQGKYVYKAEGVRKVSDALWSITQDRYDQFLPSSN